MKLSSSSIVRLAAALLAAGVLSCVFQCAMAITYEYDPVGRLARVTYDNGVTVSYLYDANGNLLQRDTRKSTGNELSFTAGDRPVSEAAQALQIPVRRTVPALGAVSVNFNFADGTATLNQDYAGTAGSLIWPDGDSADKVITVSILSDLLSEGSETFTIALANPSGGATLAAPQVITITVVDSEAPMFLDGFEDP